MSDALANREGFLNRIDGWFNTLTGLGGTRDKTTSAQIGLSCQLADTTLEAMFSDDDIAAKIVSKLPKDAMRRGFELKLGADASRDEMSQLNGDVMRSIKLLGGLAKLRETWTWGRLYGGAALFVGADDGLSTDIPLDESRIRSIKFLTVLKRAQLAVDTRYKDPTADKFDRPEVYRVVNGLSTTQTRIHESRLILFGGATTARGTAKDDWDDSVLQRVYSVMMSGATAWQSSLHLMSDASQGVLKVKDLLQMVGAKDGGAMLSRRMQALDMARSVCRSIVMDADKEDFTRVATSFTGIPEMLDRVMMRTAAAADMPVTMLFGRSPAGMNATGESDTRGWYDEVEHAREDVLLPRLERLLTLVMLAKDSPTSGKVPDDFEVCFPPLWQPTAKELAETRKINGDRICALVTAQVILPEHGALELSAAGDLPMLDVEAMQRMLAAETKLAESEAGKPDVDPSADPGTDPNADTVP